MLRHRVLRRLIIDLGNARSDNLIALIFLLAQSQRGLRNQISRPRLGIAKLRFVLQDDRRSYLLYLCHRGLNSLRVGVPVAYTHIYRRPLPEAAPIIACGRRRLLS